MCCRRLLHGHDAVDDGLDASRQQGLPELGAKAADDVALFCRWSAAQRRADQPQTLAQYEAQVDDAVVPTQQGEQHQTSLRRQHVKVASQVTGTGDIQHNIDAVAA